MSIHQPLFEMTTTKGIVFTFAVMDGEQCAILRDGDIVEAQPADDANLGRALRLYFKMIEQNGGARHPFQPLEGACGHPHAG